MKLIIFDLDQTIVELFKYHNKATELTFKKVFNIKAKLDEIDFPGQTIEKNLEALAILKRIKNGEIRKKLPKAIYAYSKIFVSIMPKNIKKDILPGVYDIIKKLSRNKGNKLVIVTGDSKLITQAILKKAGLLKYFAFMVTGEREMNRVILTKQAIRKAKIKNVIIIGDSIHEVEAGKAVKALTISVLTGFHSKEELKKAGSRDIFKNLDDKRIIKLIEEY